jgi:hypothetical protein
MNGSGRASFALQLHYFRNGMPEVFRSAGRPRVCPFSHGRGRCDRIDGDDFIERVSDPRDRLIRIERFVATLCFVVTSCAISVPGSRDDVLFLCR